MSGVKNNKNKALKGAANGKNCFFKAFLIGAIVSGVCMVLLCLAVSAFMCGRDDSLGNMGVISPVITAISLAAGGFACGKTGKNGGFAAAFLCGCACLGICYALSTVLELSDSLNALHKTLTVALMLVCPVMGAKLSGSGRSDVASKRRVKP